MGRVRQGEFTTMLGCRVRVLPVADREDDADTLLDLRVVGRGDDRQVTVLLSSADRVALRELLDEDR